MQSIRKMAQHKLFENQLIIRTEAYNKSMQLIILEAITKIGSVIHNVHSVT